MRKCREEKNEGEHERRKNKGDRYREGEWVEWKIGRRGKEEN